MASGYVDKDGHTKLFLTGDEEVQVSWSPLVDVELGRGTGANAGRTYIGLRRTDGTQVFLSVDTGTTLVVSTTRP